jgi:hypothetical protein
MIRRHAAVGVVAALVVLASAPATANPTDDVRAAMLRLAGLSSYRMTFATPRLSGTMDFVKPNAARVRIRGVELVRIGSTTYLKAGSRAWTKVPDPIAAAMVNALDSARVQATQDSGFSASDLGVKKVGGEILHAYHTTQRDGTNSIVFVARDGFVHRITGTGAESDKVLTLGAFNGIAPILAPITSAPTDPKEEVHD